jgi:hypothetical protein
VIKVELSFPDQAALIAFFLNNPTAPASAPSATVTPAKQEAALASTAAGKPASSTKAAAEPTGTAPIDGKPTATTDDKLKAPTVDYPTLQKAVFELVKLVKDKGLDPAEHVLSIAKTFGYDNFAKMKDDGPTGAMQFAPALEAVKAKTVEIAALQVEESVA